MKKLNKKGFTLIELIVVIAILAILAAILIPAVTGYISKAEQARDAANCRSLYAQTSLETMLEQDPTIADSPATVGDIVVTYAIDANNIITNFACVNGGWSLDLK